MQITLHTRHTSAGWYPDKCQFSPDIISAMHLTCLDSGLRQNDEKVLL